MRKPTTGYIEAPNFYPNKADWEDYTAWCRKQACPRLLVAKATYWKVEFDVRTVPHAQFSDADRRWFAERARLYMHGGGMGRPSRPQARAKITPVQMTVYGLSHTAAESFAGEIVDRFPVLRKYTCYPLGTRPGPVASRGSTAPGKPPVPSLKDRVRGAVDRKVIDLATERRKRRNPFSDPWEGGPA